MSTSSTQPPATEQHWNAFKDSQSYVLRGLRLLVNTSALAKCFHTCGANTGFTCYKRYQLADPNNRTSGTQLSPTTGKNISQKQKFVHKAGHQLIDYVRWAAHENHIRSDQDSDWDISAMCGMLLALEHLHNNDPGLLDAAARTRYWKNNHTSHAPSYTLSATLLDDALMDHQSLLEAIKLHVISGSTEQHGAEGNALQHADYARKIRTGELVGNRIYT